MASGVAVPVKLDFEKLVRVDNWWSGFARDAEVKTLHETSRDQFEMRGLSARRDCSHIKHFDKRLAGFGAESEKNKAKI